MKVRFAPGAEFTEDVCACTRSNAYACCSGSAPRRKHPLCEGPGSRMARETSGSGSCIPGPCVMGNDDALQRMSKTRPKAVFVGRMVVKIFV